MISSEIKNFLGPVTPSRNWFSFFFLPFTFFLSLFLMSKSCQALFCFFFFPQPQLMLQKSSLQLFGIAIYSSCSSLSHHPVSLFQKCLHILDHFCNSFFCLLQYLIAVLVKLWGIYNHLRILSRWRFCFRGAGLDPRICISINPKCCSGSLDHILDSVERSLEDPLM